MVLHPDIQRKSQRELDEVLGHGTFPNYEDRDSLPYLTCVIYEVLRLDAPIVLRHHGMNGIFTGGIQSSHWVNLQILRLYLGMFTRLSSASGVPHRVMEDDVYEGMFIPKGSTIISNIR